MVFASLFLFFVGLVLITCTLLESINSIFTDKSINPVIDFNRIFLSIVTELVGGIVLTPYVPHGTKKIGNR